MLPPCPRPQLVAGQAIVNSAAELGPSSGRRLPPVLSSHRKSYQMHHPTPCFSDFRLTWCSLYTNNRTCKENTNKYMAYNYQYPRAALTVDCVVFGFDESELKVLLIQRALDPFKGKWALPGGVVRVAHYALVKLTDHKAKAATDAANAQWFPISKLPKLAFDHADIVAAALARLQRTEERR